MNRKNLVIVFLLLLTIVLAIALVYERRSQQLSSETSLSEQEPPTSMDVAPSAPSSYTSSTPTSEEKGGEKNLSFLYTTKSFMHSLEEPMEIPYLVSDSLKNKLTEDHLIEIYLLASNNSLAGFVGRVNPGASVFVWDPMKLIHNGGLDFTVSPTPRGGYRFLILGRIRHFPPPGYEYNLDTDTRDNPYTLYIGGSLWNSGGMDPWGPQNETELLASDVSPSFYLE